MKKEKWTDVYKDMLNKNLDKIEKSKKTKNKKAKDKGPYGTRYVGGWWNGLQDNPDSSVGDLGGE